MTTIPKCWMGFLSFLLLTLAATSFAAEGQSRVQELLRSGRYPEAETAGRQAVEKARATKGALTLEEAMAIDDLVDALIKNGKSSRPETREICERAVKVKRERLGAHHPAYGASMRRLGAILTLSGQYEEAGRVLREAKIALEPSHDGSERAAVSFFQGVLDLQTGKHTNAETSFRDALDILRADAGGDSPQVCEALNGLATALYELGDFAGAIPVYEEALAGWVHAFGTEHPQVATCRHNLGSLYSEIGDEREARPQLEEALRIRLRRLAPNHPSVGSTQLALAETLGELGAVAEAEDGYRKAVANRRKAYGDSSDVTGWALMKYGLFLLRRGKTAEADRSLAQALTAQEVALGPEHQDLAWTLTGLAVVADRSGDRPLAKQRFLRALAVQERAFGPEHPDVALTLSRYADFLARSGEMDGALDASLRSMAIGESHLRLTARGVAERQGLAYVSARRYGLDVALEAAARGTSRESLRRIWNGLIRMRTLVFDEVATRQRILGAAGDSALAAAGKALEQSRSRLANSIVRGDADAARSARAVVERLERDLATRSESFRSQLARQDVGFDEVAAALPESSALVAYVKYDTETSPRYLALVLRRGGDPVSVALDSSKVIDRSVTDWLDSVSRRPGSGRAARRAEQESRHRGARLRGAVWDPVRPHLEGVRQAFVVLDGSLYGTSIGALPSGNSGFLVEELPVVHYLSSERDLARPDVHGPAEGLLAIGGPNFDEAARPTGKPTASRTRSSGRQGGCTEFDRVHFEPLPGTAKEVQDIAALWADGTAVVLTGNQAREKEFKRRAPGKRVLHLATHGFFLGADCAAASSSSRGIGITIPAGTNPSRPRSGYRQLLRSGLALAGANRRADPGRGDEDGIVTAEEIVSLDLSSVDWAVLSACDTGRGDILDGEGVLGLRRAFEMAGVGTTILSLWAVDDEATRTWMKLLYEWRLRRRVTTAEAVRNASVEMLEERRAQGKSTSPFYWAAFVATGDWH